MLKDVDRELNNRGMEDAPVMAKKLAQLGIKPDLFISSHARRAHQTANIFAKEFDVKLEDIVIEKHLYHGDIEEFINATLLVPDSADVAIMFGHNPGITYFANVVCEANIENVPTSGVLVISSKANRWVDTDISDLQLTNFIYPRMSK